MSNMLLYTIWGVLYILTAGLGFIPEAEGFLAGLLILISLAFFVPGFMLLYRGEKKTVRILSLISLGTTVLCLLLNVWSVGMSRDMGEFLYVLLGLVSAPMFCGRIWLIGLFGWSSLLMGSLMKLPTLDENNT